MKTEDTVAREMGDVSSESLADAFVSLRETLSDYARQRRQLLDALARLDAWLEETERTIGNP